MSSDVAFLSFSLTFIVGLVVGVAANYLVRLIDIQVAKYSDYRRVKDAKRKEAIDKAVREALADPSEFVWRNGEYTRSVVRLAMHILGIAIVLTIPSFGAELDALRERVGSSGWLLPWFERFRPVGQGEALLDEISYVVIVFFLALAGAYVLNATETVTFNLIVTHRCRQVKREQVEKESDDKTEVVSQQQTLGESKAIR